ncbi:AMP-binding enzyme [Fodinicola feengrottensis]|uniref:AMP-binding enzyme n=1 Tax=Fodinicola feengrottensis TaxID=435914 RepID=UPI0036F2E03F
MLAAHPSVADVAVVGVPDEVMGERTCAVVVPTAGTTPTLDGPGGIPAAQENLVVQAA